MTCKFEAGKEYKTRDGRRAKVYAVYEGQGYPIHGAIFVDTQWVTLVWQATGRWLEDQKDDYDLMPPVREWDVWVHDYGDMTSTDMSDYGWKKIKVREVIEN